MKSRALISGCAAAAIILAISGCNSGSGLYDKRWDKLGAGTTVENPPALIPGGGIAAPTIWVGSIPATPPGKIGIKDLPDHAAAAYLEQLGKFSTDAASFAAAAAKPLQAKQGALDTTSFDRVLIIAVTKAGFYPADRLVRTKVTIESVGPFDFANYTIAATAYTTVNVDSLSNTRTATYSAELDPTATGTLAGGGKFSAGLTKATTSAAQVSTQIEQLTVWLENGKLVVYRESDRGLDRPGTTFIQLSLKRKDPDAAGTDLIDRRFVVSDMTLEDKSNNAALPKDATMALSQASLAKVQADLTAKVSFEYIYRHVLGGQSTYNESDDTVEFLKEADSSAGTFTLMRKKELNVPLWIISYPGDLNHSLAVVEPDGSRRQLIFSDFGLADHFAHWVQAKKATMIGNQKLVVQADGSPMDDTVLSSQDHYPTFVAAREN